MSAPASSHAGWERDLAAVLADIAARPGRLITAASASGNVDAKSLPENGVPPSDTRR